MSKELIIPRTLAQKLFTAAQDSPDTEICGFVASAHGQRQSVYPIRNVATNPKTEFEMCAEDQVSAMKKIRECGQSLFAVYHSHPTAPPIPSVRDLEHMGYPEAWMMIISLNTKGVLELRAWSAKTGEMQETPVRILMT